jgi:hypothetical protein
MAPTIKVHSDTSYVVHTSPREVDARMKFIRGEITKEEYMRISNEEPMTFEEVNDPRDFTVRLTHG